jgi:hypothetical protein
MDCTEKAARCTEKGRSLGLGLWADGAALLVLVEHDVAPVLNESAKVVVGP